MNRKPKILFILKQRLDSYGGTSVGLINSAIFVCNTLISHGVEAKVVIVKDANDIDREVMKFKPSHVILEAIWVPPYKMVELLSINRYKKVQWIIRIHSKTSLLSQLIVV